MKSFAQRWRTTPRLLREESMAEKSEPKLLLPQLRSFYDFARPFSWLMIRFAVAWNLLVHAWGKLQIGTTPNMVKGYTDLGLYPGEFWYWASTLTELIGGIGILLGLFTRFFAAAVAIE